MQIRVPIDRHIVEIISRLDLKATSPVQPFQGGENDQEVKPGQQAISSLMMFQDQSDDYPMSDGLQTEAEAIESEDAPLPPKEEQTTMNTLGHGQTTSRMGKNLMYVRLQ
jgi:hypothetical protein